MKTLKTLVLCLGLAGVSGCTTAMTWERGTGHPATLLPLHSTEVEAKAEPQYLLLMPFAVPVDVLTFPLQLPFILSDKPFIDG